MKWKVEIRVLEWANVSVNDTNWHQTGEFTWRQKLKKTYLLFVIYQFLCVCSVCVFEGLRRCHSPISEVRNSNKCVFLSWWSKAMGNDTRSIMDMRWLRTQTHTPVHVESAIQHLTTLIFKGWINNCLQPNTPTITHKHTQSQTISKQQLIIPFWSSICNSKILFFQTVTWSENY